MDVARSYTTLVEDKVLRDEIFILIEQEFELSQRMVLMITGEEQLAARFRRFNRKLQRRGSILKQVGLEQVKLVRRFRERGEGDRDVLEDLVPLLLSINCVSSGLGWTG